MTPVKVSDPPVIVRPPVPEIVPAKVSAPLVRISVAPPRATAPFPLSDRMALVVWIPLLVTPEISRVPLSTIRDDGKTLAAVR